MIKVFFLRWIGIFLVLSSLAMVVLTFGPVVWAEGVYRWNEARQVKYVVLQDLPPAKESKEGVNLLSLPRNETVLEMTPLSTEFGLLIPKIGANAKVIADVDAGDHEEYQTALKKGVAHAAGTAYPGEAGNSFLFAHSAGNFWEASRWNAIFYLLKELRPGDEVVLFYQGKRFDYVVYGSKVVEAHEGQYLSAEADFPMLTLQTCWPPGTDWKRLLVFARLRSW